MCVPLICRQLGTIPEGEVSDALLGQYDLAPTLTDWAGFPEAVYERSPGRSFAALLRGEPEGVERDAVFFEQEETRAVHTARFAYWKRRRELGEYWRELGLDWEGDPVLFDLDEDPGQERDVAADPRYAGVVADLDARLDRFFGEHADPRYDLWSGGVAKGSVDFVQPYRRCYGDGWATEAESRPAFREPG